MRRLAVNVQHLVTSASFPRHLPLSSAMSLLAPVDTLSGSEPEESLLKKSVNTSEFISEMYIWKRGPPLMFRLRGPTCYCSGGCQTPSREDEGEGEVETQSDQDHS